MLVVATLQLGLNELVLKGKVGISVLRPGIYAAYFLQFLLRNFLHAFVLPSYFKGFARGHALRDGSTSPPIKGSHAQCWCLSANCWWAHWCSGCSSSSGADMSSSPQPRW